MTEETITFEVIRRIQRDEQRLPKLTKLPDNFYQNVFSYLQQKRKLIEKEEKKVGIEIKNIERLIEEIFNRRERKILNLALIVVRTNILPENLTDEEKIFFDQLTSSIKKRREDLLNVMLESETKEDMVIFKEDVPEFIGSDLKKYGPFKKGDIAKILEENKKILIEKGFVEEFKKE